MSAFVVLSLALAVVAVAVTVVVARELVRNVRKLGAQVRTSTERLVPLSEELQAELAVTSVETDTLMKSVERLNKERSGAAKRSRRSKSKRRR